MKTLLKVVQHLKGMHCPYLRTSQRHHFSTNDHQNNKPSSPPANEKSLESSTSDQTSASQRCYKENVQQIAMQLSPEAQRAVLASKVFTTIRKATLPDEMQKPLRQQVIDAIIVTRVHGCTFKDQIKNEILQMVTSGIQVDLDVFSQDRVRNALQVDDKGVPRLIFYPTATVTSRLFNCLQSHLNFCFLGSYGIGKTISIIFFVYLAKHINKLMYLSLADWVPIEKREKYYAQYQFLKKSEILVNLHKCWYWSIDPSQLDDESDLMSILKKQTSEMCLTDELERKMHSFEKLKDLSAFLYGLHCRTREDIRTKFIFDQINTLLSYFARWNLVIDRCDALIFWLKKCKQAKDLKNLRKRQLYNPSKKTLSFFRDISLLKGNYIVTSQNYVDHWLLNTKSYKFHPQKLAYFFGQPGAKTIEFDNQIKKQKVKLELAQIFCQLLLEKCKRIRVPDKFLSQIRSALTPHIMKVEKYHRFLFIRQYLNLKQEASPLASKCRPINFKLQKIKRIEQIFLPLIEERLEFEPIEKLLEDLIANYKKYCLLRCQLIVLKYIHSGGSSPELIKRIIIHQIRNQAKHHPAQERLLIKLKNLQAGMLVYTREYIDIASTFYQRENYNKQIIPCHYYKFEYLLEFQWNAQQFLEITESIDVFQLPKDKEWKDRIEQPFKSMIFDSDEVRVKYLIAWIIRQSSNVSFNTFKKSKYLRGKYKIQVESKLMFQIAPAFTTFWTLNKQQSMNNPKATIRKNLKEILYAAKKHPDTNILGIPYSETTDDESKITENEDRSQNIDFLFVKFFEDKYFITSFDVTIRNSSVKSKGESGLKMWQALLKPDHDPEDTNDYVVNHIVLCRRNQAQNSKYVGKHLSLSFCSIQSFEYDHQGEDLSRILETWYSVAKLQDQREYNDQSN